MTLLVTWISHGAYALAKGCDNAESEADTVACLEKELRDSDVEINKTYQTLMDKVDPARQRALRNEQRAWLKMRDATCELDSKESDRERWMQVILRDYTKTVCVVRFTRTRVALLNRMLLQPRLPTESMPLALGDPAAYERHTNGSHEKGKWYYEVKVDLGTIARTSPTALFMGFASGDISIGNLLNVTPSPFFLSIVRVGLALDLDNGKFYSSVNGVWRKGAPDSAMGMDVKLGRAYGAKVTSSVLMQDLLKTDLVRVNFGDKPFDYPMPPGYRPFVER